MSERWGRFLCLIGRHDWSHPVPLKDVMYRKSTRRRAVWARVCLRLMTCKAKRYGTVKEYR